MASTTYAPRLSMVAHRKAWCLSSRPVSASRRTSSLRRIPVRARLASTCGSRSLAMSGSSIARPEMLGHLERRVGDAVPAGDTVRTVGYPMPSQVDTESRSAGGRARVRAGRRCCTRPGERYQRPGGARVGREVQTVKEGHRLHAPPTAASEPGRSGFPPGDPSTAALQGRSRDAHRDAVTPGCARSDPSVPTFQTSHDPGPAWE